MGTIQVSTIRVARAHGNMALDKEGGMKFEGKEME